MSFEIKVPVVGESITEVTVASFIVEEGATVEIDDSICEIESDKATFEVPAEVAGVVRFKVEEGDTVPVGGLLAVIEEGEAQPAAENTAPAEVQSAESEGKATGEVIEMRVVPTAESITEVTIGEWLKEDGDFVELDEEIVEIETDKAALEWPAEASGILRIVAQTDDILKEGDLICKIEVVEGGAPATAPASTPEAPAQQQAAPAAEGGYAAGHPSPAAGKILAEKGVNPAEVQGSGPGGRITKADAQAAQKAAPATPKAKPEAPKTEAPAEEAPATGNRNESRERMTSLRRTIARRLVAAKNETAMLTTFNEVDMSALMNLRKNYKEKFKEKHEIGLGFMSFFTKAVTIAAAEWPAVNAQIDGNEIVYHDYCDVSIAVSSPRGLVVPVIRNAEQLSFAGVEKEVVRLAKKARDGKLTIPEMTGGTFTITNGGIFGSMLSTPIINAPQSAILGLHNIVERPVAINGQVEIRPIMYVALSYDHRIVDGRESVSFLYRIKELIEDPARIMLHV